MLKAQSVKHSLILEDLKLTKDKIQETYEVKDGVTEFNQKNIHLFGYDELVLCEKSKIQDK